MSPRKLALAALTGSLVIGAGAALAQVGDSSPPATIGGNAEKAGVVEDLTEVVTGLPGADSPIGEVVGGGDSIDTGKIDEPDGDTAIDEDGGEEDGGGAPKESHGHYVSGVAHATPSGPGKGAIVSAAARSGQTAAKAPKDHAGSDGDGEDAGGAEGERHGPGPRPHGPRR